MDTPHELLYDADIVSLDRVPVLHQQGGVEVGW